MQEIGLNKGEFNESSVEKMSKEPQTPLKGLFGNDQFGQLVEIVEIEDLMEDHNDVLEESQTLENDNADDEFGIYDIID